MWKINSQRLSYQSRRGGAEIWSYSVTQYESSRCKGICRYVDRTKNPPQFEKFCNFFLFWQTEGERFVQPSSKLPCLQYTIFSPYLFAYRRGERHPSTAARILGKTDTPFQTTPFGSIPFSSTLLKKPHNMIHFCLSQYSQIIVALRDPSAHFFSRCSK
jgi:hypothetical protein